MIQKLNQVWEPLECKQAVGCNYEWDELMFLTAIYFYNFLLYESPHVKINCHESSFSEKTRLWKLTNLKPNNSF